MVRASFFLPLEHPMSTSRSHPATADPDHRRLVVFDTTLRDGEQAPGFNMNLEEKLLLARALSELGVDVIEAGFPAASPGDLEAVRAVAREVSGPTIAGLARCTRSDIEAAWAALSAAAKPRIHVFLATSALHREHKLKMAKAEIVRRTAEGVALAREFCDDVEFSPEDASRTEHDFLAEVVETAIAAGASTINVPDTVGYTTPEEFSRLFTYLRRNVRGIDRAVLSVHCHNDLGMAVANSLAAVQAGVRQVECTINGIGERAGNCSLEEIVMALRTRRDLYGVECGIHTERLVATSRLLSSITGVDVPPNKAIVGANAFAHEAGIHQHGVMAHAGTYEIMRPEDVGLSGTRLVLGKHSGRHAFVQRVRDMGYEGSPAEIETWFAEFKKLADRKKEIHPEDIEALIIGHTTAADGPWRIDHLQTSAGTGTMPSASVRLVHAEGYHREEAAVGDGPIDATFKALVRATGVETSLRDYHVRSVTLGEDAQGRVTVSFEHGGKVLRGRGVSTDIVEASALAFLDGINQIPAPPVPAARVS